MDVYVRERKKEIKEEKIGKACVYVFERDRERKKELCLYVCVCYV